MQSYKKILQKYWIPTSSLVVFGLVIFFAFDYVVERYENQMIDAMHIQSWTVSSGFDKTIPGVVLIIVVSGICVNIFLTKKSGSGVKKMATAGLLKDSNPVNTTNERADLLQMQETTETLKLQLIQLKGDLQKEIVKRTLAENALRESEERFQTLIELSPDAIILHSDKKFILGNSAAMAMFRLRSNDDLKERSIFDFMNAVQARSFGESIERMVTGSEISLFSQYPFIRLDGDQFYAEVTATKLQFQTNTLIQIVIRDITERSKNERQRMELEQQLLHVQKKEIISTLASGLAHDILNILGIIGTAINKLIYLKDIDQKSLNESADQISKATERGRSLVRQLLTFARKSELNFDLIQINPVIMEIATVIQRTFPLSTTIEMNLSDELPEIRADGNQIHQALLNLCLNSRDAINGFGTIVISSFAVEKNNNDPLSDTNKKYVCISVADNGCGMSNEIMDNIFQPFFTTKNKSEGSGLGLAMVNGIMENHRGFIEIDSTVGVGTTFKLYFPI